MYRVKINVNSLKQKNDRAEWMAGLLFHNFSTFPILSVFSGKGEGAAWCLMGKTGWRARKKKKGARQRERHLKVQRGGSVKPQLKPPRRTLERLCEHMFKWVIHEMFHNRNACQSIKCVAMSHLFPRVCNISFCRVRITCYFASFPDL